MRWAILLAVIFGFDRGPLLAQSVVCPALEVSIVTDELIDSARRRQLPDGTQVLLTPTPLVTNADVTGASAALTEGQYVLNVEVSAEAGERIKSFSERNVGQRLAFLVDGRVLRIPTIQDPIEGNAFLIGPFDQAQAERMAQAINAGCRG